MVSLLYLGLVLGRRSLEWLAQGMDERKAPRELFIVQVRCAGPGSCRVCGEGGQTLYPKIIVRKNWWVW